MSGAVDPRVHAHEPRYRDTEPEWRPDGSCSYCGSMSPDEALRRMRTPGAHFSGTDKVGYKAYFDPPPEENRPSHDRKFYFRHLRALSDEKLAEFTARSRVVLGLDFRRASDGGIECFGPRPSGPYGWQTWGVIGADGEPVFDERAPKPPGPEFWK